MYLRPSFADLNTKVVSFFDEGLLPHCETTDRNLDVLVGELLKGLFTNGEVLNQPQGLTKPRLF